MFIFIASCMSHSTGHVDIEYLYPWYRAGDVYRFNESDLPADVLVDDLGVRLSQSTLYVGIGSVLLIYF